MKKKILLFAVVGTVTLTSSTCFSGNIITNKTMVAHDSTKTETFKVYGNCGMCKKTIEGALKNVKGIVKANWNRETKMMEVTFNGSQLTLDEVKKRIATVGYDTDQYRATDESYNDLPGCCQYERPDGKHHENNDNDHDHQK